HDWGAALAWALATFRPDTVDHLVVLSVGHPATFRRTPRQREKSWYMLLFQFPGVAERWLTEDGWFNFRAWGGHPDAEHVSGPWRYERLEGPGHWMQLDAPDQVNALLTDFLPAGRPALNSSVERRC